jgi:hypothetical protein
VRTNNICATVSNLLNGIHRCAGQKEKGPYLNAMSFISKEGPDFFGEIAGVHDEICGCTMQT